MKKVAPASGQLGVLLPGMGSVATTFMAGVEMVRKGWEVPIGSVTQLGLMRWGKAAKQQKIRDLIPLANLSDLIFAGWDVFSDDCYTAALKARVLNETHLESVKEFSLWRQCSTPPTCQSSAVEQISSRKRTRWIWPKALSTTSSVSESKGASNAWS